ncbi:MAG: DUF1800 domain-containing protein [Ignavibacteriae bacterium]|nr:DUF1800 domain-containing protein [Ignavibacteriota bacterium]
MLKKVNEWNESNVKHLLSRTMYGFKREDIERALTFTLDDFVDTVLLMTTSTPAAPGSWVNLPPDWDDASNNILMYGHLGIWQYELMRKQTTSFREKMVNFLSNHFVSEADKVFIPQFQYFQNFLFREYAFGNFKELTKKICIDPAMLIYLDGEVNTKDIPNENFARELLELFTIGIGNYTEEDIRNGARAFTGWYIDGVSTSLDADLHDSGIKEFLNESGNFDYSDIVDIIFSKEETAKFICRKIYKEFVYYIPDESVVTELANIFRDNNYELKPVFSAMFKSDHFYNSSIKGAKIKSPYDLIVGTFRQFNITSVNYRYIANISEKLQQFIFNAPDVRGWEGQRKWISTSIIPLRNSYTDSIMTGKNVIEKSENNPDGNIGFMTNIIEFARSFESSENADQFISDIIDYLFLIPINQNTKDRMLQTLLDGSVKEDWSTYSDGAEARLINFFKVLTRLPEFQLI